jgi:hypothetical protein
MKKAAALCLQRVITHTPPYVRTVFFSVATQPRRVYRIKISQFGYLDLQSNMLDASFHCALQVEANALNCQMSWPGNKSFKKLLDTLVHSLQIIQTYLHSSESFSIASLIVSDATMIGGKRRRRSVEELHAHGAN